MNSTLGVARVASWNRTQVIAPSESGAFASASVERATSTGFVVARS